MPTAIKFGRMIKEKREVKSISQEKLAKKLGLSRISINNYEQGKQSPSLDTAVKIALYLDIDLNKLAQEVDSSSLNKALNNLQNKDLERGLRGVLVDLNYDFV